MKQAIQPYLILWLLLIFTGFCRTSEVPEPHFNWRVGEELFYKVKYAFFTLGTLHLQVLDRDTLNARPVYHCKMHIHSNSIFIKINDFYESYVDEELYSHAFLAYERQKDYLLFTRYDINYKAGTIKIVVEKQFAEDTVRVIDSTATVPAKVQDGLSLLYYARANSVNRAPRDVAVFVFNQMKSTYINFTGEIDDIKARGVKVKGYYLDGRMKFVGIAGLKDDFKGWFSLDKQRVPLHARMKAFIGSVKLNLEWWKNWEGEEVLQSGE